jgi:hypothetical protein
MLDGFSGCVPVKGHHGSRPAGRARNLCAPAIAADRGYFDPVLTAVDRFFEALDGHGKAAF